MARLLPLLPLAALLAACGSSSDAGPTTTTGALAPIVVEAPAAGAEVPLAFTVSGTASVFEATLVVELRRDGQVVQHRTVTASEGAPGRGTFSVRLHAPSAGPATVAAYSPSAADGSRQHEQDVPVTVTP
jgi:immunoglobulin-like protein involved in spore germination